MLKYSTLKQTVHEGSQQVKLLLKKKKEKTSFLFPPLFLSFSVVQCQSEINFLPSLIDNHVAQMFYFL